MIGVASRWNIKAPVDAEAVSALAAALRVPRPLATLLIQRGYDTVDEAKAFLRPSLGRLSDPMDFRDMDRAVAILSDAIDRDETIFVHGDYDVDGQCAAALLTRVIRLAGGRVVPFVPHRIRDGYDFGPAGLKAARECGASVVLTCDCGTTAVGPITDAKAAGLKVIVTDHHLTAVLPPADAVINPNRFDCPSTSKELCGAGVAFKLAQALVAQRGMPDNVPLHFLDFVALATIADIVPLVSENRILVRYGLKSLAASRHAGIRALVDVVGLRGKRLRAGQVGFVIAPRLNAAGRIGDAMDGLLLLLTDDDDEAVERARALDTINARRQQIDVQILDEALDEIDHTVDLEEVYGLVLARDAWHPGVIGIVASRIVERFGRPTILVALEGETGRGSGRSIPKFDLHAALVGCQEHLERWGGHRQAAGLTIHRDCLDGFRSAFNAAVRSELSAEDLVPQQKIDVVVALEELDMDFERILRHLEPCGAGNPQPVLGVRNASARYPKTVGTNHLRFNLEDASGRLPAIAFGMADQVEEGWDAGPIDVAMRLELNEWQGRSTLQARVAQIKPAE